VPVPGVVPLGGGVVDGDVVVPVVPDVPLVAGGVAGSVAAGVAVVLVSLRLLQPPSSAQTMALPRTSLLVVRSGAVMIVPFQCKTVRLSWKRMPCQIAYLEQGWHRLQGLE
jgi:hypothetical protein